MVQCSKKNGSFFSYMHLYRVRNDALGKFFGGPFEIEAPGFAPIAT